MSIPKDQAELNFQNYYQGKVFINRPTPAEHAYQFDYAKFLQRKKIYLTAFLLGSFSSVQKQNIGFGDYVRQKRWDLLAKIKSSLLSDTTKSFLTSIILADRTEMDPDTISNFRKSGLIHLLTISGTHIGVIFGALFFFLSRILPGNFQKAVIPVSLIFIWLFALFIGPANPVIRACTMLTVYFVFIILQRKPDVLHALSLAGFVLLIDTNKVFDVGFQLSFSAVLGIFWLYQPILKLLPRPRNLIYKIIFYTFSLSLAAQLATMPLILYYFHQYSVVSIFANVIVVPFAQIIIVISFLMTILIGAGFNVAMIYQAYDHVVLFLLKSIKFLAQNDGLFFENIAFSLIEFIVLSLMIVMLRPLIKSFSLRNRLYFLFLSLSFLGLRTILNFYYQTLDEVLVHKVYDGATISVKKRGSVYFYLKKSQQNATFEKYVVKPYTTFVRAKSYQYIYIPEGVNKIDIDNKTYRLD